MPVHTIQATVNQTPDPGLGSDQTMSVGLTNTGHGANNVQDAGPVVAQLKSCRWSGFPSIGNVTKILLKFDWEIPVGGADADNSGGGSASADASFIVSYSTDNGSNFTAGLTRSVSVSGVDSQSLIGSGSESINIPVAPTSQIAIRSRLRANAQESGGGDAFASVTAQLSDLRLEITTVDGTLLIMM